MSKVEQYRHDPVGAGKPMQPVDIWYAGKVDYLELSTKSISQGLLYLPIKMHGLAVLAILFTGATESFVNT